jgi:hypothetical protein
MFAQEKPPKWTSVVFSFNKSEEVCASRMFTSKNDKSSVFHTENQKKVESSSEFNEGSILGFCSSLKCL